MVLSVHETLLELSLAIQRPMSEPLVDDRQIDVWCVRSDQLADDAELFDEYRATLPENEVEQADRFVFEHSRQEHLITRMLVRSVLSHYTGHDVRLWRFSQNDYGKPAVALPDDVPLAFNLSHAEGLVVCGVTAGCDVGIDAEKLDRPAEHLTLARRYFAPAEAAVIEEASPDERARLFMRFWTLKEAFIKARGMGLSIPLADFQFALVEGRPPQIAFKGPLGQQPDQWQFAEIMVDGSHRVAIAAKMPADEPAAIRVRQTVPLRWQSEASLLPANEASAWSI